MRSWADAALPQPFQVLLDQELDLRIVVRNALLESVQHLRRPIDDLLGLKLLQFVGAKFDHAGFAMN